MTLKEMIKAKGVTMVNLNQSPAPKFAWQYSKKGYRLRLQYDGKTFDFNFWRGESSGDPTVDECLDCLLSEANYAADDLETFCYNLGYDLTEEAELAESLYNACVKQREGLMELFGDEFEDFMYAEV